MPKTLPHPDRILASAIQFLVGGAEEDAASVLLSCSAEIEESGHDGWNGLAGMEVHLCGPRAAVDILGNWQHPQTQQIQHALDAVLRPFGCHAIIVAGAEIIDIDPGWRKELLEIARGRSVSNQAPSPEATRLWRNLRFRSESEVRIAKALDRANVAFWPNCRARLGISTERQNREADFLICHKGKFGILEVDGEPFHPPSRTVHDHERDRLFKSHGIRVCEHYDASECFERADAVVAEFLQILAQA